MKRFSCFFIWIFVLTSILPAQEREVKLKVVQTSDIHGNYYPYDFIRRREATGSLARVHALVQKEREAYGKNLILLDNGDILQGQPTAYYYNYIDTVAPHLAAEMMNFMGYNAGNMGNHDVETGRTVFDRWAGDCRFPILGANIVDTATGETHFKPYEVLERDGVKIVVLGKGTYLLGNKILHSFIFGGKALHELFADAVVFRIGQYAVYLLANNLAVTQFQGYIHITHNGTVAGRVHHQYRVTGYVAHPLAFARMVVPH